MKKRISSFLLALLMVVSAVPVMATATVAVESEATLTADDLYVTNGLKIWLDGEATSTVDLAGGKWTSKWPVDGEKVTATLGGSWKAGRNAGSYRFDLAAAHLGNQLTLPISALPTGDYTIDMLTMTRGYTINADGVTSALKPYYRDYNDKDPGNDPDRYTTQSSSFVIGPLMADTFGQERTPGSQNYASDCAWNDAAWYYSSGVDLYVPGKSASANWSPYAGKFGWGRRNYAFTYEGDFPANVTIQLDMEGTTQANYSFIKNGKNLYTFNGVQHGFTAVVPVDTATMKWEMFRGFPVELYQFRVYNRVLNQDEKNLNHMADLAKYFDLDLSCLAGMDTAALYVVAGELATVGFGGTKADMQNALNLAAAPSSKAATIDGSITAYDELYAAKEDLVVLLTAYDALTSASVDLSTGRWYNKANGGADYATIVDNSTFASWEYAKGGKGFGYTFDNLDDYYHQRTNLGLLLPTGSFTDTDMAVEYVFAANPIKDAEGNQVKIGYTKTETGTDENGNPTYTETFSHGGKWGVYNGENHSNFAFAGLQICHFFLSENPSGSSMKDRVFYAPGAWEDGWGNKCYCGDGKEHEARQYKEDYLFGTKEGWNENVVTLGLDRTVTAGGDYNQASFDVLLNGVSKMTVTNLGDKHLCTKQDTFYTIDQLNGWNGKASTAGDAFFGVPAIVYAVRVYDRVLTAEEKAQNHAVDLMAYFGLDVRGFAAADDAAKTAVYEMLAGYTFNATADEVAAMQVAIDAATWGIPVAEGVQKGTDGTSLRIWASMDTDENVSKLGMTVVFKQDGVVKSEKSGTTQTAFASITSDGKTVTAESLRAELLYAAVVTGIPAGTYTVEVTPYVVLLDGTSVTGETKTMDVTFGS